MAKRIAEGAPGSGFVALSGGFGTLAEQAEAITFNQIGVASRGGIVFFSVNGYWSKVLEWVQDTVEQGFITEKNAKIAVEVHNAEDATKALREHVPMCLVKIG